MRARFKLKYVLHDMCFTEIAYIKNIPNSNIISCFMYAMIGSRLDITYVISLISRFIRKLAKDHWSATKWLL